MKNNSQSRNNETAYLGGGCFWCLEMIFSHTKGVISVMPGYAGGRKSLTGNSPYEEVSTGKTGHAEIVRIVYDTDIISYKDLLRVFFSIHDPTTPNRQGSDIGTQYRSIILYTNNRQKETAAEVTKELAEEKIFKDKIITEIAPLVNFREAEEYHRKYFEKNPEKSYCQIIIAPKLAKFRNKFSEYYTE